MTNQQIEIKTWFNKTYRNRPNSYLRPRVAYETFFKLMNPKKNSNYLDIACGLGKMLEIGLDLDLHTFGIDISEIAVEKSKLNVPNATITQANAESLPFKNNYFDYISCIGSLERMINIEKVLSEKKRVAKTNATFCLMVRNSDSFRWKTKKLLGLINIKGHQNSKKLDEWKELFISNNFEIITVLPDQWIHQRLIQLLSLGIIQPKSAKQFNTPIPLKYADEFIFILKLKTDE